MPNLRGLRFHPVGGLGAFRGNEPAGMTLVTNQPYTSLPSNNCTGFFTQAIVDDGSAVQSPTKVWECVYPGESSPGANDGWSGLAGDSPGLVECSFTAYKRIYMDMTLKFSSNFQGHASGVNKIIHWFGIGGTNKLFLLADGGDSNAVTAQSVPLLCGIGLQGVVSSPFGTSAQVQPNVVGGAHFTRGSWDHLEMDALLNTSGNADGVVKLWLNGTLVSQVNSIQFTAGAATSDLFKQDPTWGGQNLPNVLATMSIRVDHIYVSGSNA